MIYEMIVFMYFLFWYLLVIVSFLFCVSGLDDLFIDVYYWSRYLGRKWKTRNFKPFTSELLKENPEKNLAVMLPCWHEAGVIGTMLAHNCLAIEYAHYDIFVGVYPNDLETVADVQQTGKIFSQVHCVIGKDPGPTNKAANLNQVYQYIRKYEQEHNKHYDIFVFHDSEDVIHPLSFRLYNHLIPRKDMVQIPVFPMMVNYFYFTHWVYNDEFCESHTKDIIVREAIQGLVPSAGVGTAFSANALATLSKDNNGVPFATYSLTEDYKTALSLRVKGFKQIFVAQQVLRTRWKRNWLLWGNYHKVKEKEYIATRALFPMEYRKSVRQKARWIMGIGLQEWQHTGLVGNFATKYTLLHDRKAVFTHFISMLGYIVFFFWLAYLYFTYNYPQFPSLQEQLNLHPLVWYSVLLSTFIMFERFLQRFIATTRVYGWIPALLSIPRLFYGNIINLHALCRAYRLFFFAPKTTSKATLKWEKTDHEFPGVHVLVPYKRRLGDVLLQNNYLSEEQLEQAVVEQSETGEQLGSILQRYEYLNQTQLMEALASQYHMKMVDKTDLVILKRKDMSGISWYNYRWLFHYGAYPIKFSAAEKKITVAISDPSNQFLLKEIIKHLAPYAIDFVLFNPLR